MSAQMAIDAFTISSNNYLGMSRVLAESYLEHHPGARVWVCLVDRHDDRVDYADLPFEVVLAEDIGVPHFEHFAFKYSILELNTAVKPFFFKYLRDVENLDRAFYFDPDILVYDRLAKLEEALGSHLAALTPHLTQPLDNRSRPPERVIGMCGIYNLGFLGLRLNRKTAGFLDWWCDRLYKYCVVDLANGMFVDQSWMDFAPAYLESVAIVRDPIFNVAYWNLPHRQVHFDGDQWEIEGERVGFFHFSGVDIGDIDVVSRHQDRIDLWSRPELRPLFEQYRDLVRLGGQKELSSIDYAFGVFESTDIPIPWFARTAIQEIDPKGLRWADPFSAEGSGGFLDWLVEPVGFGNGIANRAALLLWSQRPDVRTEFPNLNGPDHGRFLDWYLNDGAVEAGLHDIFFEGLRSKNNRKDEFVNDPELQMAAAIDLTDPGEHTAWLNEPVDDGDHPVITRLAALLHRTRPDVAAVYPELRGVHRLGFAYWVTVDGRQTYGLHPDLVDSISKSLPLRSRLSSWTRRFSTQMVSGRGKTGPRLLSPHAAQTDRCPEMGGGDLPVKSRAPGPPPPSEPVGVNIVGHFEGARGAFDYAAVIRDTLANADVPVAVHNLHGGLPESMISSQLRFEEGVPFPVTILATPPGEWAGTIDKIPIACRAGARVVGYLSEEIQKNDLSLLGAVDEVWAPSGGITASLFHQSPVPVRRVPARASFKREPLKTDLPVLDSRRIWFLAQDPGDSDAVRRGISLLLECIRRLDREKGNEIGLCVAAGPAGRELERQVQHLPVVVDIAPPSHQRWIRLLHACDGLVDAQLRVSRNPVFEEALIRDIPTVSLWSSDFNRTKGAEAPRSTGETSDDSDASVTWIIRQMREVAECARTRRRERVDSPRDGSQGAQPADNFTWKRELERLLGTAPAPFEDPVS